ncbi:MAG: hypothetical protein Fur0024_0810 [Patescibacteria group bacterium]
MCSNESSKSSLKKLSITDLIKQAAVEIDSDETRIKFIKQLAEILIGDIINDLALKKQNGRLKYGEEMEVRIPPNTSTLLPYNEERSIYALKEASRIIENTIDGLIITKVNARPLILYCKITEI